MRILILGGTGEARELAGRLVDAGHEVITSLAGRTQTPVLPRGYVRIGGFGGADGLEAYLRAAGIERVVDASHPYAQQISANACTAAKQSDIRLVRLSRPEWKPAQGAEWTVVQSAAQAAAGLPPDAKVLLTTGHTGLEHFLERDDCTFIVRLIEPPAAPMPTHVRLLLSRPPYSLDNELALMRREAIAYLVSKNSGGGQTAAKLEAARQLGVKVIMIARPAHGPAIDATSVEDAIAALNVD